MSAMTEVREMRYMQAVAKALHDSLEADPTVMVLGEDIAAAGGSFKATRGLLDTFGPQRVLDTPISESSIVSAAVGAALTGMRPVVEIMFMDFIALAMDQLVNHAAKVRYMYNAQYATPMVVRTPFGGGRGYGPSHSQSLESWFMSVAGIKVVCPSTPADAKQLLAAAIADNGPVLFLEHKLLYGEEGPRPTAVSDGPSPSAPAEIGSAAVRRVGHDITLISYGLMCRTVEGVANALDGEGVSCEVVDLRTLKPLDSETLRASVRKTGRAVIVEEGNRTGGVGAEVAALLAEDCLESLRGRVVRVGSADAPLPAAPALEQAVMPQVEDIVDAVRRAFEW